MSSVTSALFVKYWFYFRDGYCHFSLHLIDFLLNFLYSFYTLIQNFGRGMVRNVILKYMSEETSVNCFSSVVVSVTAIRLASNGFLFQSDVSASTLE